MRAHFLVAIFFFLGCSDDQQQAAGPVADAGSTDASDAGGMRSTGLPLTCQRGTRATELTGKCNGEAAYCSRGYDRVVTPMTHNAHAVLSEGFAVANQNFAVARQLEDGIRGFMLDTYYFDPIEHRNTTERLPDMDVVDQAYLCHGGCTIGNARLIDRLCSITGFLDAHREEVLSIIFENYLQDEDTDALLKAAGLGEYLYTHPAGAPWPTLGELVQTNKRLVVFLEHNGGSPAYLHPAWTGNIWDTPYTFDKIEDFSCKLNRGKAGDPLFLINHWLTPPTPDRAREVNVSAVLGARVDKCTTEAGRPPTFVGVDYYDIGDLFSVVRKANGL